MQVCELFKETTGDGVRVDMLTARAASKIFTDQLAQNSTKLSKNMTSQLRKWQQCIAIFKNSSADGPGCIPCKTYAEGTPGPKLSYAEYFQGERAAKI